MRQRTIFQWLRSILWVCSRHIPPLLFTFLRCYKLREIERSCLAHLLRTAQGLTESLEAGIARFGARVHGELQRLCHMGTERPTVGQWRAWYARFRSLVNQHAARQDNAGTFARRLDREGESLWVFLDVQGVEAPNNIAERAHRFGVLWRKRSQGTCSEKGNR